MQRLLKTLSLVFVSTSTLALALERVEPAELIVKLSGQAEQELKKVSALSSLNLKRKIAQDTYLLRYSSATPEEKAAKILSATTPVLWAQPNYRLYLPTPVEQVSTFLSNDPLFERLWNIEKVMLPEAWQISQGSQEIIVADIDTGVDYGHEDLGDNMWFELDSVSGERVYGYNFIDDVADPYDDQGHGTHTSGTIGAIGNNGKGVIGASPNLSIMALKFISKSGFGTTEAAIRAIDFAIEKGARVMSNSWGGYADPSNPDDIEENIALLEAVERANDSDILFVAAAGNDAKNIDINRMYPGGFDTENVLTVASSSPRDKLSFFSNYGIHSVDVAAPGSGIWSTMPGSKEGNSSEYGVQSGTSMAAPLVSGIAALLLAVNPELSAAEVKQIIIETVDTHPLIEGKILSGGIVNARKAVERAHGI